ncbi:uncharacterized protein N7506_005552 [Penicillium brevicompactum]|uniref:uncharacterized protein n=1 Tax=Penicillium brevicompactum TaxID=5074 RepID=UPI002540E9FB|nr:uncharacterized protein N7506_005552 [Penicillium brevicompactum]KAJ5337530.1 hypothetical protein N7506_005552 [Penicillium brevicompactum]
MASNGGVNKSSTSNTKGNKSHLPEMVELAEGGRLPRGLMESADAQASFSQKPLPTDNSSHTHDGGQLDDNGLIDQANSPQPPPSPVVESIEIDDTPMHDAGTGSSSSGHERPPAAGHSHNQDDLSPSARGTTEPEEPELLATLDPSNDEEEGDALIDGQGASTNPINLDGDEAPRNPVSSGAAVNSNTNAVQNKPNVAIGQRAIRTEAEFMAEWKEKKGWDDLNDNQREACLTVAKAMYDLYRDTIAQNMEPQGTVNTPIGQRPGVAVAAH